MHTSFCRKQGLCVLPRTAQLILALPSAKPPLYCWCKRTLRNGFSAFLPATADV